MTAMRAVLLVAALAAPAAADTFGGFSGVDRPYLVNQDKVCTPLPVVAGKSSGTPTCAKLAADVVAKLSIKAPIPQRGATTSFSATASGRTLTVASKTGDKVISWDALDPIGKVVEVYASQYDDRVAVAYVVRRMGKEVTDIVAFDLGKPAVAAPKDPTVPTTTVAPTTTDDPAVTKLVTSAKKAAKAKALAAWKAVLVADASHGEALYRVAALQAAKQPAEALATLGTLAASTRADKIEWLIEARFDAVFAALRADAKFRAAVGLDKGAGKGATPYERLMGFGGQWEQTGTSCDKPEVRFTATRDRVVRIRVKSVCSGSTYDLPFKGAWRLDGDHVVLTFPTKGKAVSAADEAGCQFESAGDEDALRCSLGRDIDFVVLPTRR